MRFATICLALMTVFLCTAASFAVEVGGLREKAVHKEPISLGGGISKDPYVIHHNAAGSHLMAYQIGLGQPNGSEYHFGKDFSLGNLENIYYGTPFTIQFLEDP